MNPWKNLAMLSLLGAMANIVSCEDAIATAEAKLAALKQAGLDAKKNERGKFLTHQHKVKGPRLFSSEGSCGLWCMRMFC